MDAPTMGNGTGWAQATLGLEGSSTRRTMPRGGRVQRGDLGGGKVLTPLCRANSDAVQLADLVWHSPTGAIGFETVETNRQAMAATRRARMRVSKAPTWGLWALLGLVVAVGLITTDAARTSAGPTGPVDVVVVDRLEPHPGSVVISPSPGTSFQIDTGPFLEAVAPPDGDSVFALYYDDEQSEMVLASFDLATGELRGSTAVADRMYGPPFGWTYLAVSDGGERVYVPQMKALNRATATAPDGSVSIVGRPTYEYSLLVIDGRDLSPIQRTPLGNSCGAAMIFPLPKAGTERVGVLCAQSRDFFVIEEDGTGPRVVTLPTEGEPENEFAGGVVVDTGVLVVEHSGSIHLIDIADPDLTVSELMVAQLGEDRWVSDVAIDPSTGRLMLGISGTTNRLHNTGEIQVDLASRTATAESSVDPFTHYATRYDGSVERVDSTP